MWASTPQCAWGKRNGSLLHANLRKRGQLGNSQTRSSMRTAKLMEESTSRKSYPTTQASLGQLADPIPPLRDLGAIKYIKDEDDADLHTDLSVYDALGKIVLRLL